MAKDNGIAKLPNNVIIPEELRDALAKHDWTGPRNLGKNTFDANCATTKELEEAQWSGFRVNTFTSNVELWCVGRIMGTRKAEDVARNPNVLAELHEEVFQTTGTVVQIPMPIPEQKLNRKQRRAVKRGVYKRR